MSHFAVGSSEQPPVWTGLRPQPAAGQTPVMLPTPVRQRDRAAVPLGTAVSAKELASDPRYAATFLREFGSLTPENAMKAQNLQPGRGIWDFTEPDRMVAWALAHGKEVRGHTLVWYRQLPDWLRAPASPWDRKELRAVLKAHVQTVVSHYRGRVSAWDVVNEPFNDDGSWRSSVWFDTLGPAYVELAFRWARQADPRAKLALNEYELEQPGPKAAAMARLVRRLRARGVPIDTVGLQGHVFGPDQIAERTLLSAMRRYAKLGVQVEITEMDVPIDLFEGSQETKLARQADVYAAAGSACRRLRACSRFSTWGVHDASSWLGKERQPLLFDGRYRAKPALRALRAQLRRAK